MAKEIVIKSSGEIREILRHGRRIVGENLSLYYKVYGECGPARVAFTVSRKTRRAVDRNRLKRLMREAYRHNAGRLAAIMAGRMTGIDIVMSCSFDRPATMLALKDIEKDFDRFLAALGGDTTP